MADATAAPNPATPASADDGQKLSLAEQVGEQAKFYYVKGLPDPYPGLKAYTYADRNIFAGRSALVADVLARLTTSVPIQSAGSGGQPANPSLPQNGGSGAPLPLLFVTGASGCGKSSFVQAGLIPALMRYYGSAGFTPYYATFRPGSQPITAMFNAFIELDLSADFDVDESIYASAASFTAFLHANTPPHQVNLLLIDQFEELYTQAQADQRDKLLTILATLAPFSATRTQIICTMRVDYLSALSASPQLFNQASAGVQLLAMTTDELKEAIQTPILKSYTDKVVEPGLAERLANEVTQDPSYLPLLQMTIKQIWSDGWLRLAEYLGNYDASIGSVLGKRADDVYSFCDYDGLRQQPRPAAEQQIMLETMLDLVQITTGEDLPNVPLPRERSELVKGDPNRDRLIEELVNARLLSANTNKVGAVMINIIHVSLIRNWQRLQSAIIDQREQLERRLHFTQALDYWQKNGSKDEYLMTGVRLAEAKELTAVGDVSLTAPVARDFFKRSDEVAQAENNRQLKLAQDAAEAAQREAAAARLAQLEAEARVKVEEKNRQLIQSRLRARTFAAIVVSILLIVAVIASVFAIANGSEATIQRNNAVAAQQTAVAAQQTAVAAKNQTLQINDAYRLASNSRNQLISNPQVSVLLGYEALARDDNEQSVTALNNATFGTIAPIVSLSGFTDVVESAVYSPDGSRILAPSHDGTARIWDEKGNLIAILKGHTGQIHSAVYSPDGSRILTASDDKTARLWDSDGKPIAILDGNNAGVISGIFSPDGNRIVTTLADGTVRLWDKDGKPIATLSGHTSLVYTAAYSPDGSRILTASADGTARLWSSDGTPIAVLRGHTGRVNRAVYSADGSRILTASADGTARLWDKDGNPIATLSGHSAGVNSAVFSPDGSHIITASDDGTARLWSSDGKPIAILSGHTNFVYSAIFSADDNRILTASADGTARLWDKNGKPIASLIGHTAGVICAIFSHDGNNILTASADGTVRLWNKDGNNIITLSGHTAIVNSATYSPDRSRILTASADNTARLWGSDGKAIATLSGHTADVNSAVYSADGSRILTASADNTARLLDKDGKPITILSWHTAAVTSAVYSPDGQRILTASADGTARLWDKDGKPVAILSGHTNAVSNAVYSPDGNRILTASVDNTARLWDKNGKPIAILSGHTDRLYSAVYSPDGSHILTASRDRTARLWDKDGKLVAILSGHNGPVNRAIYSPDGSRILTASDDGTARLWDKDGKPIATLIGHNNKVIGAVYSPDGNLILTTATDGTARLWDKDGKPLAVVNGQGLSFSADSKLFLVADNSGQAGDYPVHAYPAYADDLLKIAACRVSRSLTADELQQFQIAQPLFDISKRVCPPQVSWQK